MPRSQKTQARPAVTTGWSPPTNGAAAPPAANVSQRLRELRTQRRLSLRALAERSGLSVNTLSLIENDKSSPSVATLQQAATALGVPISAFFATSADVERVVHQRSGQRGGISFARGLLHDLGAGMARRGLEPLLLELEPQGGSGRTPVVHTGREFVFCLEGRLTYTIDGVAYELEPGDSLLFDAYLPHLWRNASANRSRSLLIFCPADERDQPAERHFLGASANS